MAKLVNDCYIKCNLCDHVQRQIYFIGLYEPIECYMFAHLVKRGMTVVDAGANVGQYTMLASTLAGPSGQVHAFEPVSKTFDQLEANTRANNLTNVRLCRAALWCDPTTVDLGLCLSDKGDATYYSISRTGGGSTVRAPGFKLDDYVEEHQIGRIDVIKMDIEGSELFALKGMQHVIKHHRPLLLMEINRPACTRAGYSPEMIWDFLVAEFGYKAWIINQSAESCRQLTGFQGIDTKNVLFHSAELPPEVTAGWDLKSVLRWARS
jgi:FkbM family methyltransferase